MDANSEVELRCRERGLRMTGQRRVIAHVLSCSRDHPNADLLYARAATIDPRISIATVYRTLRLLEEMSILERRDFGDGKSRYELAGGVQHDHLIDIRNGEVIEFSDVELETLLQKVVERLGYRLIDRRLELFGALIAKSRR